MRSLWMRLLGMRPRTAEQWRAWAVEQAVKSGSNSANTVWEASEILRFVFDVGDLDK